MDGFDGDIAAFVGALPRDGFASLGAAVAERRCREKSGCVISRVPLY